MTRMSAASAALFDGKDEAVRDTYARLLETLDQVGPFTEEAKKTSIHLVRSVGFAGVHPRKSSLILNLRTEQPIDHARIAKVEQVSKNRYHCEVKLSALGEVDDEITGWLRQAYTLG